MYFSFVFMSLVLYIHYVLLVLFIHPSYSVFVCFVIRHLMYNMWYSIHFETVAIKQTPYTGCSLINTWKLHYEIQLIETNEKGGYQISTWCLISEIFRDIFLRIIYKALVVSRWVIKWYFLYSCRIKFERDCAIISHLQLCQPYKLYNCFLVIQLN